MDALPPQDIQHVRSAFIRYMEVIPATAAHENAGTFPRELVPAMAAHRTVAEIRRQTAHG